MLKIHLHEILTPNVIGVSPLTPAREALNIMQNMNISCLLVLEGDNPVGIVTERNIVLSTFHQGLRENASPWKEDILK